MKELQGVQLGKITADEFPLWAARGSEWLFSIWLYRIVRVALSAVFFWSGVTKLFCPLRVHSVTLSPERSFPG